MWIPVDEEAGEFGVYDSDLDIISWDHVLDYMIAGNKTQPTTKPTHLISVPYVVCVLPRKSSHVIVKLLNFTGGQLANLNVCKICGTAIIRRENPLLC